MRKSVYLFNSGELHKENDSLVLIDKSSNKTYIPIEQINLIVCFKEVTINSKTLFLLNKHKIAIHFLNFYGNLVARYIPKDYVDAKAIIEQVNAYTNDERRTIIVRTIIVSSLKNCIALLKFYSKKGITLADKIKDIKLIIKQSNHKSINELLLLEARAKKIYYSCFDLLLEEYGYSFIKRTTRPPKNEINAMISFGYSILYSKLLSIIDRSKLLSQISFIHSLSKRNESLQFDIADIVKPYIVDRLVIRLVRRKLIKSDYFDYGNNQCLLSDTGKKWFVKQFNETLNKTIKVNDKYYSYQSLLIREVQLLTNYILDETFIYRPYIMKW